MTPLMCAAYKGKAEMCELLIAQGADVNSNHHEQQVIKSDYIILSFLLKSSNCRSVQTNLFLTDYFLVLPFSLECTAVIWFLSTRNVNEGKKNIMHKVDDIDTDLLLQWLLHFSVCLFSLGTFYLTTLLVSCKEACSVQTSEKAFFLGSLVIQ